MKPTPSKVVLLMSAAGLGMSCSGVALASRDNHAFTGVALTFGIAPRSEQGCHSKHQDAWASCPLPDGELLRTIVAESAALPLPLAPLPPSSSVQLTLRAFHEHAAATAPPPTGGRAGDGEPAPSNEALLLPQALASARVVDAPDRDPVADALALIVLDDPKQLLGDGAADSDPTNHSASMSHRSLHPAALGDVEVAVRTPVGKVAHNVDTATHVPAKPSATHRDPTSEAIADDWAKSPSVYTKGRGDRGAGSAQPATRMAAAEADSASIDLVFASLAEVLGSQLDESTTGFDRPSEQVVAPERSVTPASSAANAAVDLPRAETATVSARAASGSDGSLKRSDEADDIMVVSSHSDKVLMSLAALRSGEDSTMARLGAQTKKTVVVRHTDKVLETLALFQPKTKKPNRAFFTCSPASAEVPPVAIPGARSGHQASADLISETMFAGAGAEPDILFDLLSPADPQAHGSTLQAASTTPAPPDQAIAGPGSSSVIGGDLVALSANKLDEVRGGFVTDGGLRISFGIERAVYLNGSLVTTTSLNIADLSKIAGGQAQVTGNGLGSLALLQSGSGNVFSPGSITTTAAGLVIQNTLDNQKINTITRIDAVVNSSGIMRSINLQSSMQSAIVNSLRR